MRAVMLLAVGLLALPAAAATSHDADQGEPPEAPDTLESGPGISFGVFVLLATLLVAGALAYVTTRRGSRGRRGGWRERP